MADQAATKHFGWFVPKGDGAVDLGQSTREFSQESWDEFERIVRVTGEVRPFVIDWLSLEHAFSVLEKVEAKIVASLESTAQIMTYSGVAQTRALAMAQGAMSNFLSSASAFRDRAGTRLREQYGKESLNIKKFLAAQADAYDSSFAYRFLYNLRNYGQHHEIPLSAIPVEADRDAFGKMNASVTLIIRPQDLLKSNLIQKRFREKDLVHHPEGMPLLPMANEFFRIHRAILRVILDMYVERLKELQHYAGVIFTKMNLPKGAIPVIWEGEFPRARHYHFSFDELAFVKKLYERLVADGMVLGPKDIHASE